MAIIWKANLVSFAMILKCLTQTLSSNRSRKKRNLPTGMSLEKETKARASLTSFLQSCQIVKFTCSHTISSITLQIADIKKAKMVRVVNLYYNNKTVSDVAELRYYNFLFLFFFIFLFCLTSIKRNKWGLWKKAKTCHLSPYQTELKVV